MDYTKCMHGFPQVGSESQSFEAIKALHQTVVSLRTALDKSKSELQELKSKSITDVEVDIFKGTIEKLSLENHILRQRVLITQKLVKDVENTEVLKVTVGVDEHSNYMDHPTSKAIIQTVVNPVKENFRCPNEQPSNVFQEKEDDAKREHNETKTKASPEKVQHGCKEERSPSAQKFNGESDEISKAEKKENADKESVNVTLNAEESFEEDREVDSESEELDDIELIFTTEDTKDLPTAQENLVSITDAESWNPVEGTPVLLKYTEAQQFDEAPEDTRPEETDSKICRNQVDKGSEYELEKTWENSVPVETDISKCGIAEENDVPIASPQKSRRNTLPTQALHRPIIHGDKIIGIKGKGHVRPLRGFETRPCTIQVHNVAFDSGNARPILVDGGHGLDRRESGAQTDITALPSRWRSEGYLAHKVSHNFTTLPSKFTMPPSPLPSPTPHRDDNRKRLHSQSCRDRRSSAERRAHLRLNEEFKEARRTLLSDINFTSMVPELSRSADHLCQDGEGSRSSAVVEGGRMDLGLGRKFDGLPEESSNMCCNIRGFDGYRWGCNGAGRRGTCTARPTTWDCPIRGTSNSFKQGQKSWSPIPSTPNAQDVDWNTITQRRIQGKMPPAESPVWTSSVPTSPTHLSCAGKQQSYTSSSNYSHHYGRRQSGPPLYYSEGINCVWGYEGTSGSSKTKSALPYSASTNSFSGAFCPRKGPAISQRAKNRVTFKDSSMWRSTARPVNSLPDLRDEYSGLRSMEEDDDVYGWSSVRGKGGNSGSGGDSTDSLIDEAEEYLRRSIDSILTGVDWARIGRRRQTRRHSDPDPVRELRPPQSAQPFLPKEPKDLRPECFVKVILKNGKVAVGRVRYSGIVRGADKEEYIVGVELPCHSGDSDGTFRGIRYFDCNSNRAVFIPFKKVIIAWNT